MAFIRKTNGMSFKPAMHTKYRATYKRTVPLPVLWQFHLMPIIATSKIDPKLILHAVASSLDFLRIIEFHKTGTKM